MSFLVCPYLFREDYVWSWFAYHGSEFTWPLSPPLRTPVCPVLWYPSFWERKLLTELFRDTCVILSPFGAHRNIYSGKRSVTCVADWNYRVCRAIGQLGSLMSHIKYWFPYVSNPELIMGLLQLQQLLSTTPEITHYTWELFKNPQTNNAFYYAEPVHSFLYIQFVVARGLVTCCLQLQLRIDLPFSHKSFSGKEITTWDIMYGS